MKCAILLSISLCALSSIKAFGYQHHIAIIAHRGASASAPENTLAAFKQALTDGADMLELDVQQTRDSELVIIHDQTIDRTTNGNGKVKDFTYRQLEQFDAGSWFEHGRFPFEHIPRLQDVIDILDSTTKLLLEIKEGSDIYPNIEYHVVDCIERNHLQDRVIIKSFADDVLNSVRRLNRSLPLLKVFVCQLPIVKIVIERGIAFGSVMNKNVQYLQPHWIALTERFVEAAHEKGLKVFVWNVNTESRMKTMIELGLDGIETDHPGLLRKLLQETEE